MVNNISNDIKNPPKKRGIFYLRTLVLIGFCFFSVRSFSQPQLKFTETKKSFGTVKKGEVVVLEYEFTNAGTEPLVITDFKVECSCTSAEFPKQPIAPNQKDKVIVKFDTKTVWERQDRIVEIYSNVTGSPTSIRFKGFVQKK